MNAWKCVASNQLNRRLEGSIGQMMPKERKHYILYGMNLNGGQTLEMKLKKIIIIINNKTV